MAQRKLIGHPDGERIIVLAAKKNGLYHHPRHPTPELGAERPLLHRLRRQQRLVDCRDASLWAAVNNGEVRVYRSADLVWHVEPGRPDEPESVYAGVMPAALFRLRDGGDTWQTLAGDHPGVRSVNVAYAD